MKSKWQEYKEKNGVTPLDFLNPQSKPATDEEAERRYNICQSCEHFYDLTKQCKQCGCFMFAKTKLNAAKCPLGRW